MRKKTLAIVMAVVVVCAGVIGGTIAWLTASAEKSNTFTVGHIDIALDGATLTANKIIPGTSISMSPAVTVKANSESCWVFAEVDNGLVLTDGTVPSRFNINSDWTKVATVGNKALYAYKTEVSSSASDQALSALFTAITIDGASVTKDNISQLNGNTVSVKAYAHQSASQTKDQALAAAEANFGGTWTNL